MTVTETVNRLSQSETGLRERHLHPAFLQNSYEIKQRFFKWGTTFDMSDGSGNFLIRARRSPLHVTKKYSLYDDPARTNRILSLNTRGSIPQTYDVTDGEEKI